MEYLLDLNARRDCIFIISLYIVKSQFLPEKYNVLLLHWRAYIHMCQMWTSISEKSIGANKITLAK